MNHKIKKLIISLSLVLATIMLAASTTVAATTTVYAQQITTTGAATNTTNVTTTTTTVPTTPRTQQIIDNVLNACSEEIGAIELALQCVSVVYDASRTLVLTGELLIISVAGGGTAYVENRYIWIAVEEFRALGHTVDHVLLSGQGTQGNPHQWYIVMSK
jgi:ABC-type glycerol-3-phosphate transport system substrate-binding protein